MGCGSFCYSIAWTDNFPLIIVLRFVSDIMMGAFEVLADLILPENWTSNDAQTVKMTLAVSVPAFLIAYCLVHATPHPKTGRRMFTYAGSFIIYTLLPMITIPVSQRHLAHCFSAVSRPFSAVFPPFFCAVWLPGAKTERTGEKWRKMGEIWGRNGRETAVAEWRWTQRQPLLVESAGVGDGSPGHSGCVDNPLEWAAERACGRGLDSTNIRRGAAGASMLGSASVLRCEGKTTSALKSLITCSLCSPSRNRPHRP